MNFTELLHENLSDSNWSISNEGSDEERYESLIFHGEYEKPSFEQFQEWQKAYDEKIALTEYQRLREKEYPPISELVVALWENIVEGRPEFSLELQEKRMKIKEKYRKKMKVEEDVKLS